MKTAVDELIDYIENTTKLRFKDVSKNRFNDIHKEQITKSIEEVLAGFITNGELRHRIAEKYYTENFINKNQEQ